MKIKNNSTFQDINSFLGKQFKKYKKHLGIGKKKDQFNQHNGSIRSNSFVKVQNKDLSTHPHTPTLSRSEIEQQRRNLPVFKIRQQIIKAIEKNSTVIFIGETASGKTTQIPQFILESKMNRDAVIAVTQPRRVAAISIATRVAIEQDSPIGQYVGYCVRFEEKLSEESKIKYMTDGMLLREAISDHMLSKYSVVILDEAHERSIQTDVLFGIVKRAQQERSLTQSPLKVVVMSATMDVDHFSTYFNNAPVYYLEGRQFPIQYMYVMTEQDDYVKAALVTVLQIHRDNDDGDILVFCTGQEEINTMVSGTKAACNHSPPQVTKKLIPLPLHASLPASEQMKVFLSSDSSTTRKVIYATNVAETSITIPGIRFVVDTCRVKTRKFDAKTRFESLKIERISRAQAEQRAGRAGREAPGICYRLLTQDEFSNLKPFPVPEILRVNLSNVLLHLIAIGIKTPTTFDFMNKPRTKTMLASLQELLNLKAIDHATDPSTGHYRLTPLGKEMVTFPLNPKFSRTLVASKEYSCSLEVITILSVLYVDTIFYIPPNRRDEAPDILKKFTSSEGDNVMMLNVFRAYTAAKGSHEWCLENFIHERNMEIVKDVRKQLLILWERSGNKIESCHANTESIRRCFFHGLVDHIAVLSREGHYRTPESKEPVFIHPSSCLFGCKPEFVVYTELIETTKHYMRNISLISLDWLSKRDTNNG